ncbi:5'-3' exonuclease [Sporosarcina sp. NCCP-2331]|nr:5'-3' exonuclease [Sporosarcina sp. NCCP-2331]GLB57678.1 5'-3' exonuclease [Sporosarcina sp. NCCP-2378]
MNEMKPHILVIDGMALLFRSFFATAHSGQFFPNAYNVPTNGVQGFVRHTMSAISIFQPTHLAVCWDMGSKTFRNELFPDYKSHRPAPAPELVPQFDMAREVSETLGWKSYGIPNMEADDLIGSLIKSWNGKAKFTVVSGDKDLLQLLRPDVTIALTKKGYTQYDEYNAQRFIEEYGITPGQFVDMKAFTGDSSDGYPGVKGIGPKTALKLIQQYGSVDGVLAAKEELAAGVRKKIETDEEMLMLSIELAEIHCELTLDDPLDQLTIPAFTEETARLMEQQGYSLIARQGLPVSPF